MPVQLTPDLERRLEHLAAETHRSPNELAQQAVSSYIRYVEDLLADVRAGDSSAERDGVLTSEQVLGRITEKHKAVN